MIWIKVSNILEQDLDTNDFTMKEDPDQQCRLLEKLK